MKSGITNSRPNSISYLPIRVDDIQTAKQVLSQVNQKEKEIDKPYYIEKLIRFNIEVKNSTTANRWLKKAKEMGMKENAFLFYQINILMKKGKKQKSLKLAEHSRKKYPKDLNLLNITGLINLQSSVHMHWKENKKKPLMH